MGDKLQDLVEANLDGLMESDGDGQHWPKAWATLRIDLRLMSDKQRQKVWQAEALLKEAGLQFDSGVGGGEMEWEFDWSLRGAFLHVVPFRCHYAECANATRNVGFPTAYWSLYRRVSDDWHSSFPHCSESCREAGDAERTKDGGSELVMHGQAKALLLAAVKGGKA